MLYTDLQESKVVFGAWASWTDNYEEYAADVENKNYCAYEPMMFAFVYLVCQWVGQIYQPKYFSEPLLFSEPRGVHWLFLWLSNWLPGWPS